jgi:hypothetical protein
MCSTTSWHKSYRIALLTSLNQQARKVISDAVGEYVFIQIPSGTYRLTSETPGFTTATRDNTQLLVNIPATLDLRLEVGATTETVNVQSEKSTVNTDNAVRAAL